MKISVIGGGSWGTALVKILCENPNLKISWWLRNPETVDHIKKLRHNPKYLSSVEFHPSKVKPTHKIRHTLKDVEWVILATPSAFLEETLAKLEPGDLEGKYVVSAIKGMVPTTNQLVSDYLHDRLGVPLSRQCVIAGPCHAEEVALEKQSYLTIAGPDIALAENFAALLACRFVKTRAITDLYGAEYVSVIKNIVALANGITHGMGVGDNFQAVLVSNAMLEIERFVSHIAPTDRALNTSAYLGDLLVTAYSSFSRNRAFGNMIGRGYTIKAAQLEMNMIAEGYYAVKSIYEIIKDRNLTLPIITFAYNILYKNNSLNKEFDIFREQLV